MTTTPPGWYDDGQGSLRWWDGAAWTGNVHSPEAPAAVAAPAAPEFAAPFDPATALGFGQTDPVASAPPVATAYPGAQQAAAPEPGRSKWWIWLIVAGAVLVVLIVLAAIFIPMAIRAISDGGGSSADGSDEDAAVAAVQVWDEAWQDGDCDAMQSVTTADFRDYWDIGDCASFERQSADLADTTDEYTTTITDVEADGEGTIAVETDESYTSRYDENGEDTGTDTGYTDEFTYYLAEVDGAWVIFDAEVE